MARVVEKLNTQSLTPSGLISDCGMSPEQRFNSLRRMRNSVIATRAELETLPLALKAMKLDVLAVTARIINDFLDEIKLQLPEV